MIDDNARLRILRACVGCAVQVLLPDGRRERATLYAASVDGATLQSEDGELMLVELHEIECVFPFAQATPT
jgi:hypothetical protein